MSFPIGAVASESISVDSRAQLSELLDAGSFALYLARRVLLNGEADPATTREVHGHLRTALSALATADRLLEGQAATAGWPESHFIQ